MEPPPPRANVDDSALPPRQQPFVDTPMSQPRKNYQPIEPPDSMRSNDMYVREQENQQAKYTQP